MSKSRIAAIVTSPMAETHEQALHDLRFNPGMGDWYHAVALCIEEQDKQIKALTSLLRQKLNQGEMETVIKMIGREIRDGAE